MPADALWAFCMALNIYLAFHSTRHMNVNWKKLGYIYMVACYGIPLIPALTYLLLDLLGGKNFYDDATVSLLSFLSFFGCPRVESMSQVESRDPT
jgi:hypothetical protein